MKPKIILYLALALVFSTWAVHTLLKQRKAPQADTNNLPQIATSTHQQSDKSAGKADEVVTGRDADVKSSQGFPARIMPNSEQEIPSDDPLISRFANEKGELTRVVRKNAQGLVVSDTRYSEGQETREEKVFTPDGKVLRVQTFRNGLMTKEEEFK